MSKDNKYCLYAQEGRWTLEHNREMEDVKKKSK